MIKKLILAIAVSALALGAQAGEIALGSSWTAEHNSGGAVALTGESATGFTAATSKGAWAYQLASAGDFTAEPFNIGDTAIMTFTTTMNAAAAQAEDLDYRFMMWDDTNGGAASVRMDWGAPAGTTMGVGVGDNAGSGSIGTYDTPVTGTDEPSNVFNASNEVSTVSMSVTRVATNVFNVSLAWDDIEISGTALSNVDGDLMESISGVGIRLNASAGADNNFTVSDLSVEVVAGIPGTTTLTYQLGGDSDVRDQGWNQNFTINSDATPTEYSWSFWPPYYYESLSNVLITVTATEANDAMLINNVLLAGTLGNSGRLDTNEVVTVKVSYEDPDNKLLDLKIDSFGPYWNNNAEEETLFSDGSLVYSITNSANGFMQNYDATGLEQLSLANTAAWSMSVYETNNVTFSGLGGLKFAYTIDAAYIEPPAITNPPVGNVEFSSNWVFEVATTNMAVLASSSDGFSVAMTNSASKRFMYKMDANAFNAPFSVGDTATWSFTAGAGSSMDFNAESAGLQGSIWDSGIGSGNGVSFQVDWGAVDATYIRLGSSSVSTPGNIGKLAGTVDSLGSPSNVIDAPGKTADFVISMERVSPTNMVATMSYDNLSVVNDLSISANLDSLNELGFRFRQTPDNALVISNMTLVITNPNVDFISFYNYWASSEWLRRGVNDGYSDDPDSDSLENLMEYALGGNPLEKDAADYLPTSLQDGNYLNLVYRRRLDADASGLNYNVYSSTDLVFGEMDNATEEAGSVALNSAFEAVTNRVPTDVEPQQFMQLHVSD